MIFFRPITETPLTNIIVDAFFDVPDQRFYSTINPRVCRVLSDKTYWLQPLIYEKDGDANFVLNNSSNLVPVRSIKRLIPWKYKWNYQQSVDDSPNSYHTRLYLYILFDDRTKNVSFNVNLVDRFTYCDL